MSLTQQQRLRAAQLLRRSGRDAAVRGPGWAASCSLNARGALDDLVHWHHDAARENRLSNARRKRALHTREGHVLFKMYLQWRTSLASLSHAALVCPSRHCRARSAPSSAPRQLSRASASHGRRQQLWCTTRMAWQGSYLARRRTPLWCAETQQSARVVAPSGRPRLPSTRPPTPTTTP